MMMVLQLHCRHYGEGMEALVAAAREDGVRLVCPGFRGPQMVQVRSASGPCLAPNQPDPLRDEPSWLDVL